MKILILNGPNLNKLGEREPEIYGEVDFQTVYNGLCKANPTVDCEYFQSNLEGDLIDKLQSANADGIIINPAAYTHYSYAIYDALCMLKIPIVEVHISNIYAREEFRKHSVTAAAAHGVISGFGMHSYFLALDWLLKYSSK